MTQADQKKMADNIFRLLKVVTLTIPIGRTNQGDLAIKYTKDKEDFEILLDSVPLNEKDYDNRELKAMLTKYLFQGETITVHNIAQKFDEIKEEKRKPGRPKKNK